jgi:hypothetical protein
MKFINANKLHRKSGGMGHPALVPVRGNVMLLFSAAGLAPVLFPPK